MRRVNSSCCLGPPKYLGVPSPTCGLAFFSSKILNFVPKEESASKTPLLCCVGHFFVALLAVVFVLPFCPPSQLFSLQGTSHQVKSVKILGANRRTHHLLNREGKGSLAFPSCGEHHYSCHTGKGAKKSWPRHGDTLSQSRCHSAGWQGTGRWDCPVVGTSLPKRGKSPQ